jgi:hypothetical protein
LLYAPAKRSQTANRWERGNRKLGGRRFPALEKTAQLGAAGGVDPDEFGFGLGLEQKQEAVEIIPFLL